MRGQVVVVVHDEPERVVAGVLNGLDLPFPVVVDRQKRAYRDWGLRRASRRATLLSPRLWTEYARMVLGRGERLGRPGRDVLQLGGDFVIEAEGTVAYSHPQAGADDRPPAGVLVRELERAAGAPSR